MRSKTAEPNVPLLIETQLKDWELASDGDLSIFVAQTARSLDTVSKLTQYEDEKANRLLTAIAFLSAFVASLFATIPVRFPPGSISKLWNEGIHVRAMLLTSVYGLFCIYAVVVGIGVALIVHGVRPRFVNPKDWKSDATPKSMLFFQRIVETHPEKWAEAFSMRNGKEISLLYIKNSIVETYLVAQKISVKIKWLKRGVGCFFIAALVVPALVVAIVATLITTTAP